LAQTQPYWNGGIHPSRLPCTLHVPINAGYCMGWGISDTQLDIMRLLLNNNRYISCWNFCDVNAAWGKSPPESKLIGSKFWFGFLEKRKVFSSNWLPVGIV
jgi:hypothetical protein